MLQVNLNKILYDCQLNQLCMSSCFFTESKTHCFWHKFRKNSSSELFCSSFR